MGGDYNNPCVCWLNMQFVKMKSIYAPTVMDSVTVGLFAEVLSVTVKVPAVAAVAAAMAVDTVKVQAAVEPDPEHENDNAEFCAPPDKDPVRVVPAVRALPP